MYIGHNAQQSLQEQRVRELTEHTPLDAMPQPNIVTRLLAAMRGSLNTNTPASNKPVQASSIHTAACEPQA